MSSDGGLAVVLTSKGHETRCLVDGDNEWIRSTKKAIRIAVNVVVEESVIIRKGNVHVTKVLAVINVKILIFHTWMLIIQILSMKIDMIQVTVDQILMIVKLFIMKIGEDITKICVWYEVSCEYSLYIYIYERNINLIYP